MAGANGLSSKGGPSKAKQRDSWTERAKRVVKSEVERQAFMQSAASDTGNSATMARHSVGRERAERTLNKLYLRASRRAA